jgi:hypothetical protein
VAPYVTGTGPTRGATADWGVLVLAILMDITKFEWEVILRYMGANADEIRDAQVRMGRAWR